MTLRIGSVCSGIGGAELAFAGLDVEHVFMSEIDPFARAVLAHRFPAIPLHGDFRTIERETYGAIDLLVGGTPCQSFSIAGLRGGLADDRGNLALEFLRLADRLRPVWILFENVPGIRSSNEGRDFGSFLAGLDELGYSASWRSFDARFAGLAQRRERLFLVGYLADWRPAAAVLSLAEGLRWDPPPRCEARERVTRPLASCARGGSGDDGAADNLVAAFNNTGHGWWNDSEVAGAVRGHLGGGAGEATVVAAFDARQSDVCQYGDLAGALDTDGYSMAVTTLAVRGRADGAELEWREDGLANAVLTPAGGRGGVGCGAIAHTLRAEGFDASEDGTGRGPPLVVAPRAGSVVRRLTPLEAERLMGVPDGWTDVPYRKGRAKDGNRYRALGNSWAVPVVRWIAERLVRQHAAPGAQNDQPLL